MERGIKIENSLLLLNSNPIVVIPELAALVGLNEAIVLQQVHYWTVQNQKTGKNCVDGHYWTYNTYREWQKQFPWWSIDTIKRTITRLVKRGILVTGTFNKAGFDRTKWYRINYDMLPLVQNAPMDKCILPSPIPETTTETKKIEYCNRSNLTVYPQKNSYAKQDNIFAFVTDKYGEDRVREALAFINWYIDTAYPHYTGQQHPDETIAKRIVFSDKLLHCADDLGIEEKFIFSALERAIENYSDGCDPTIYWATTPKVIGYWIVIDENLGFEFVSGSDYEPVETFY